MPCRLSHFRSFRSPFWGGNQASLCERVFSRERCGKIRRSFGEWRVCQIQNLAVVGREHVFRFRHTDNFEMPTSKAELFATIKNCGLFFNDTTKLLTIEKIYFCDSLQLPATPCKFLQVHDNILDSTLM